MSSEIIDTSRGEKADPVPLTMAPGYCEAFQRRVRQTVEPPDMQPLQVWGGR